MCQIASRPENNSRARVRVARPAAQSLATITRRRSKRSASAPATGERRTGGRTLKRRMVEYWVTDPVRW
jgi:hypothetical protein